MNDSRYLRLLACLDDARGCYEAAEPAQARALADELPDSDPRVFLLRMAARMAEQHRAGIRELRLKFNALEEEGA